MGKVFLFVQVLFQQLSFVQSITVLGQAIEYVVKFKLHGMLFWKIDTGEWKSEIIMFVFEFYF